MEIASLSCFRVQCCPLTPLMLNTFLIWCFWWSLHLSCLVATKADGGCSWKLHPHDKLTFMLGLTCCGRKWRNSWRLNLLSYYLRFLECYFTMFWILNSELQVEAAHAMSTFSFKCNNEAKETAHNISFLAKERRNSLTCDPFAVCMDISQPRVECQAAARRTVSVHKCVSSLWGSWHWQVPWLWSDKMSFEQCSTPLSDDKYFMLWAQQTSSQRKGGK